MTFTGLRVIESTVLDFILAGLISVNTSTQSPTLAGVPLNAVAADIAAENSGARKLSDQFGWKWTWRRSGGGVVTVWPDTSGKIWRIEFIARPGESDSVDLPCVKAFPIQDSRSNYNSAIDERICVTRGGKDTFGLRDGSSFETDFEGTGDGQLQQALWSRPAVVSLPPLPARSGIIMARIESNKTAYHIGEPILLRVTLINRTAQQVFFVPIAPYYLHLRVLSAVGKPLGSSGVRGPCMCEGRTMTIALDPGKAAATGYNDPRIHEPHVIGPWREWADIKDWATILHKRERIQ